MNSILFILDMHQGLDNFHRIRTSHPRGVGECVNDLVYCASRSLNVVCTTYNRRPDEIMESFKIDGLEIIQKDCSDISESNRIMKYIATKDFSQIGVIGFDRNICVSRSLRSLHAKGYDVYTCDELTLSLLMGDDDYFERKKLKMFRDEFNSQNISFSDFLNKF